MGFIRYPTTNFKNTPNRKILPSRRSLTPINTSQWLKKLFYRFIILQIFENDNVKDEFGRNRLLRQRRGGVAICYRMDI